MTYLMCLKMFMLQMLLLEAKCSEPLSLAPMDGECSIDNGLVPNMTSCRDFLICLNGKVRRRIRCAEGLLFDVGIGMCNYETIVDCGVRPRLGKEMCYTANVNITIKVENLAVKPLFMFETSLLAPRQPLYNFLLMAAGKDKRFRFRTKKFQEYGEFVSAINGLEGREEEYSGWVPSNSKHHSMNKGVQNIFPEDGDVITYKFYSFQDKLAAFKNLPGLPVKLNKK